MEKLRIIIVDDEPEISGLIKNRLSKDAPEFNIITLNSAPECLEYISRNNADCILTDYQMPAMSGMDLLTELRRMGNDTPVIFVTGQGNEEVAREAFKKGAYDYFTKEIGFAHFTRIINSIKQAARHRVSEAARLKTERDLIEERNKLQSILSNIGDGISIQGKDFRVLYQNPVHIGMIGDHVGEYCFNAYEQKEQVCEGCPVASSFDDGFAHTSERCLGEPPEYRCFEVTASPLRDADGDIVAGIEAVRDVTARKASEAELNRSNRLLNVISRAQSCFIEDAGPRELFDGLLEGLLEITGSEYGFIGEVLFTEDGSPYLKTHAITNIAWNEETRSFYEKFAAAGLEFFNLETLFGKVMTTRKPVISNSPGTDPRRSGLPEGHPRLDAFLGLPFMRGDKLVGMAGIANRPGGYDEALVSDLQLMQSTCATIIEAYRNEDRRKAAEAELRRSEGFLSDIFTSIRDGISIIDTEYNILRVNPVIEKWYSRSMPLVGKKCYSAYRGRDEVCESCPGRRTMETGYPATETSAVYRPDSETAVQVELSAFPFIDKDNGRVRGVIEYSKDVTGRQDETIKARRTFESILEAIKFGMVLVGRDRKIRHANQTALAMMGLTDEKEIIGLVCHNNICPAEKGKCPILDLGQKVDLSEKFLLTKDGRRIPILKTVTPVTVDGEELLLETFVDISAQKEAQSEAARARAFLQSVIDGTADPIMVIDPDYNVTLMNRAARRLSQYPEGSVEGVKCYRISHGVDHPCSMDEGHECPLEQVMKTSGPVSVVHRHRGAGGGSIWVEITASPMFDAQGRIISIVESSRDITDRINMENQRSDFYAMVTHDLRGALTTILGYSEILGSDKAAGMDEEAREMVKAVARNARRLSSMVDSYLTFTRLEDGHLELEIFPTDVGGLLRTAAAEYSELALKNGTDFETHIDEGLPVVNMDRSYVQRALFNLLDNALNYTPSGGKITLGARRERTERNDSLVIFVSDTGPGIPEDEREKVFDKYFRSRRTSGKKGSGLGLAIVKAVMDAHGGRVDLDNPESGGSTFRLIFSVPGSRG